jgi:hypothetical protein
MADRHDDVDAWLSERIEPLPPPPGTFDLIKRRARRRKYRRVAITATAAAAVVAAAVTVPQVVNLPVLSPNPTSSVAAGQSTATPTGPGRAESSAASSLSASAPLAPVPADFRPASVTFVGTDTGWVIGQASSPGQCASQYCTSVARTDNAGRTWVGVPAPLAGAPDGATGVSKIRFLNLVDGWAFGPQLFVTHNGGQAWAAVNTHGRRVTTLETVGDRVFAVFASCAGSGPAYAARCTNFTLYSSSAAGGDWTPVGAATTGLTDGAASEAVSLVLTSSRGYLLGPDGTLYAGPVDGSANGIAPWQRVGSLVSACTVGPAQPDGQPAGALLGAVNASELILACASDSSGGSPSVSTQQKLIFSSPNGGVSWLQMGSAPTAGVAYWLAASPAESVILGTDQGIDVLPAGEVTWRMATLRGTEPAGGFGYVGMTTVKKGVALHSNPAAGTVWFTFDGGQSWAPSPVTSS